MSEMKVIRPVVVTPAMLASTTAMETDAEWVSGTTYALGARVTLASSNRTYESVQAGNTGHDPVTAGAWWVDVGPSNRWAAVDGKLGSATTDAAGFTVVLRPGTAITDVVLLQMQCAEVRVQIVDITTGTVGFDQTASMNSTSISDWFEWLTAPFDYRSEILFSDLPSYSTPEVRITVTGDGAADAQCGEIVLGTAYSLGEAQHGARLGIKDYSKKTADDWGNVSLVERAFSRTLDIQFRLDPVQLSKVYTVLSSVRATPCVWVPSSEDRHTPLMVYGWAASFGIDLVNRDINFCTLQLEGLT